MPFKGKKIVLSGTLDPQDTTLPGWVKSGLHLSRNIMKSRLEELGAIIQTAVKKDTDYLLLASYPPIDKNGKRTKKHRHSRIGLANLDKADKYTVPIWTHDKWLKYLKGDQWKKKSSYHT